MSMLLCSAYFSEPSKSPCAYTVLQRTCYLQRKNAFEIVHIIMGSFSSYCNLQIGSRETAAMLNINMKFDQTMLVAFVQAWMFQKYHSKGQYCLLGISMRLPALLLLILFGTQECRGLNFLFLHHPFPMSHLTVSVQTDPWGLRRVCAAYFWHIAFLQVLRPLTIELLKRGHHVTTIRFAMEQARMAVW